MQAAGEAKAREEARKAAARRERDTAGAKLSAQAKSVKDTITKLTRDRDASKRDVQQKTQAEAKLETELHRKQLEVDQLKERLLKLLPQSTKKTESVRVALPDANRIRCERIQEETDALCEMRTRMEDELDAALGEGQPPVVPAVARSGQVPQNSTLISEFDAIMGQLQ
eukprot:TRINITY_DN20282_c0_g2_i2.p1 TRINITY_DN20282_c0_g2~~TRINITY_DN20282_c0_g2_i2.p1  ORF type:complete len:169 (+),score=57.11 TRINITY_DN20282_c0_g2_i2:112-618(+)